MANYSKKLMETNNKFKNTQYQPILDEMTKSYLNSRTEEFDIFESKLPTEPQLLEKLVEKLKGKSVYTNLKKILKNENISKTEQGVAISSLMTHVLLEVKSHGEYKILLPNLYERLGKLI